MDWAFSHAWACNAPTARSPALGDSRLAFFRSCDCFLMRYAPKGASEGAKLALLLLLLVCFVSFFEDFLLSLPAFLSFLSFLPFLSFFPITRCGGCYGVGPSRASASAMLCRDGRGCITGRQYGRGGMHVFEVGSLYNIVVPVLVLGRPLLASPAAASPPPLIPAL